jgi:hypothetical protein
MTSLSSNIFTKKKCNKNDDFIFRKLLRLHNARSVLFIALCLVSILEIGIGFMVVNKFRHQLSPYIVESACLFFISIVSTAVEVRAIEIKKNKSGENRFFCFIYLEFFLFSVFPTVNSEFFVINFFWFSQKVSRRSFGFSREILMPWQRD